MKGSTEKKAKKATAAPGGSSVKGIQANAIKEKGLPSAAPRAIKERGLPGSK